MFGKSTSPHDGGNSNRRVVGGLFMSRAYDIVDDRLVCTDITSLNKHMPSLRRAVEHPILQLDLVRQLPTGVNLTFRQAEHLPSHAIGVVAFLERVDPGVDMGVFDALADAIGARTHELFREVLIQRANSKSAANIPLEEKSPEEAGRFFYAFDSNFFQGADLSSLDPMTKSSDGTISIMPGERVKSQGQSGEIVECICTVDQVDRNGTSASITKVGSPGRFEVQFDAGSASYKLHLIKLSRTLVKLNLAPTSFPKDERETQKYRLIEILGVQPAMWTDFSDFFVSAAESLASLPTLDDQQEPESKAPITNDKSDPLAEEGGESSTEKQPRSTRRNRRIQESL
jgi:hypothetical protein